MERISIELIRRRLRQWSPYDADTMFVLLKARYLVLRECIRFAKTMSFLVKHSSARDGDETTATSREPNLRVKIGPYFWERL